MRRDAFLCVFLSISKPYQLRKWIALVCAADKKHPLPKKKKITLEDYARNKFIYCSDTAGARAQNEKAS